MFNADLLKQIGSVLTAIAALLVGVLPNHTIGYHVAQGLVGLGAAGGLISAGTTGSLTKTLASSGVTVSGKL